MAEELDSLEFTPTWVVAVVCFVIVFISLFVERLLHKLGKLLRRKKQEALFDALEKLKEELMLLGFISLLLTVFQNAISKICIPSHITYDMLPCKRTITETVHFYEHRHGRTLLSSGPTSNHCQKGKVPLLSLEALHHLHIFIFVLAVVHVVFCVTTMFLGGLKIREWKIWEDSIKSDQNKLRHSLFGGNREDNSHLHEFLKRAQGFWRKAALISWMVAFFKQFYGSVTKYDYIALRQGFIKQHFPTNPDYDFHKYMLRTLEIDFRKIVGISWYLWLFVVLFLLLNLDGWRAYFWLSFLPLILLLLVGAKLEHIIIRLAQENSVKNTEDQEAQQHGIKSSVENRTSAVKLSDDYFWFKKPSFVLNLIHFILFQNSFEIAFFFWIWSTYGFQSCIMEKVGFIIPRLIIGVIVQVLCSYSTLPLYALVTQMGTSLKEGIFKDEKLIFGWLEDSKRNHPSRAKILRNDTELSEIVHVTEQPEISEIAEQVTVSAEATTPQSQQ